MPTFPTYAHIVLDGYTEKPDFGVLRSEMDNSIAKQRPRRSLPIVRRDVRIQFDKKADKIAFDAWFSDDINGGTAWFDFYDVVTSSTKQARFVGGNISWSSPGNVWVAQAQIETLG